MFARCSIAILDDTLSGLDGETENHVFDNLFGPGGLFKRLKTTVILVSNSCKFIWVVQFYTSDLKIAQYFQAADRVVSLGKKGIKEQGNWEEIKSKPTSLLKSIPTTKNKNDALLPNFDKLSAQLRAKDEAEKDLSRQTGDLTLYGMIPWF